MDLHLDITCDFITQFSAQTGTAVTNPDRFIIPASLGTGQISAIRLPDQTQIYCFDVDIHVPLSLLTVNPPGSGLYVMLANISEQPIQKLVNGTPVIIGQGPQSGVFFSSPDTISSNPQAFGKQRVVVIILPFDMVAAYFMPGDAFGRFLQKSSLFTVFEELTVRAASLLEEIVLGPFDQSINRLLIHAKLLEVLALVFGRLASRAVITHPIRLHPADVAAIAKSAARLRANFEIRPPRISELAAEGNMSESKYTESFRQVFGQSVYQYHLTAKMEQARQLLEQGGLHINEISERMGYVSASKFSQAFKKHVGVLPSEYRQAAIWLPNHQPY